MAKIIKFPAKAICHVCNTGLRPATAAEIRRGLSSNDPVVRQAFVHGVQGDMSKSLLDKGVLLDSLEAETPEGSWVMLCDSCGLTSVHLPHEAV